MSMQIDFVFVWVVQIELTSVWGVEFDLLSVKGRNWLGFSLGVKNDLILIFWSKLTWFLYGYRNWCVGVENDLVLVFGSKLTWFMWAIELDLISV